MYVEPTWVFRLKVMLLGSLRWRYDVNTCVEQTGYNARKEGFSVYFPEGESRTGQYYPLNQVEIKGGIFSPEVKVVVGPNATQIYFSVIDVPSMDQLENILDNLDQVEQILNQVVVFTPNEVARFSSQTKRPVMSITMLKTQHMLNEGFNETLGKVTELAIKDFSLSCISLAQGKNVPPKQLDAILSGLIKIQRDLIQRAKEQDDENAEKYERELNEMILYSKHFEAELASAKSRADIKKIIEKYSSKLFGILD